MKIKCLICKTEFVTYPSRIKIGLGKYCSKKCSDSVTLIRKGHPSYKFWQGKERQNLLETNSAKTMFKKGNRPWNLGIDWIEMRGENSPRWNGGRYVDVSGYVMVNIKGEKMYEHRYIMEKKIGRKLRKDEHIHHINHIKTDNRLENLIILDPLTHSKLHLTPEISRMGGYACKGIPKRRGVVMPT